MISDTYKAIIFTHRYNRVALHSTANAFDKNISATYNLFSTAIVLGHLHQTSVRLCQQISHILGIRTAELKNILIIIAHSYHTHLFICAHQGTYQCIFLRAHILSLIYHQYGFCYSVGLYLTIANHLSGTRYYILCVIQVSDATKQVEAIRMECFNLNEMGGITDKVHQSLFKFDSSCARESKHQQLLVLYIFKRKQRGKFMYQDAGLSTTGTGSHNDTTRLLVGYYLHLFR